MVLETLRGWEMMFDEDGSERGVGKEVEVGEFDVEGVAADLRDAMKWLITRARAGATQ